MITGITIENFKGIGRRAQLELRPITIIFGANSSGKSTILHALHYAREIFERKNLDADQTVSGGSYIDLGGFGQFVHGHDFDKRVKLALRLDLSRETLPSFEKQLPEGVPTEPAEPLHGDIESAEIGCEVAWSRSSGEPYVSQFNVDINGESLAIFSHVPGRKEVLLQVDVTHSVFRTVHDIESLMAYYGEPTTASESAISFLWRSAQERGILPSLTESGVPVQFRDDALPDFDSPISLAAEYPNTRWGPKGEEDASTVEWIEDTLSNVIIGPSQTLREMLRSIRYLGPLRETPERNYVSPRFEDPSRWPSGRGSWDALQNGPDRLVATVGDWLENEHRLNTGYRIERRTFKEVDMADPLIIKLLTGRAFEEIDEGSRLDLESIPTQSRLVIIPQGSELELRPHDVGVGISQVIPVVVTALDGQRRFLAIEQPELHLHPRLQAELGDLFVEAAIGERRQQFLLETHSEHLILRLLKRIRETTAGKNTSTPAIKPDDLAIHFAQCPDSESEFMELRTDKHGRLLDTCPNGFFEEDFNELF